MIAIVGLGNVGEKYARTRHNAGFMTLGYLAGIFNLKFEISKKLQASIARNDKLILAMPTTMMNSSGNAVLKLIKNYKLKTENLFLIHDDLDLELGEYKIQFGKGPKIHNGVNSVEDHLGTSEFWRLRIGVDNRDPENRIPGEAYVLQSFSEGEIEIINNVIKTASVELLKKVNG